jgi:hypothetical protein
VTVPSPAVTVSPVASPESSRIRWLLPPLLVTVTGLWMPASVPPVAGARLPMVTVSAPPALSILRGAAPLVARTSTSSAPRPVVRDVAVALVVVSTSNLAPWSPPRTLNESMPS